MNTQLEFNWGNEFELVSSPAAQMSANELAEVNSNGGDGVAGPAQSAGDESSPEQRILALEQALDQCQSYIDELKAQLSNQAFLEEQLAATEEFSHIQKQAIVTLKTRMETQEDASTPEAMAEMQQRQGLLEADLNAVRSQLAEEQVQRESLQARLAERQQVLQDAEAEVERLAAQIESSQTSAVQETQQRIIAQTTTERLRNALRDREETVQNLEAQLRQTQENVAQQQAVIAALQKTSKSDSHKNQAIQSLSTNLLKAQTKISKLESQVSQQSILQAQFQHSTQEIEEKARSYQERSEQLEAQVAEMQEQILHQAQQGREYETAIQHWKDRCLGAEQSVGQLKEVLRHMLADRKSAEPLTEHQLDSAIAEITASLGASERDLDDRHDRKNLKLDLPAIMNRWRTAKS